MFQSSKQVAKLHTHQFLIPFFSSNVWFIQMKVYYTHMGLNS